MAAAPLVVAVADCEWRVDGVWRQDVNALSSIAYLVAAAALVAMARRRGRVRSSRLLVAGTALIGAGSFAYHAGSGPAVGVLHDVPIGLVVGYVAGWHLGRVRGDPRAASWLSVLAGIAVASGWLWSPAAGPAVLGVVAVLMVVAIAIEHLAAQARARERRSSARVGTRFPPVAALAVMAVSTWVAGHAASPLCDPASYVQPHALWHLSSAALIVTWFRWSETTTRAARSGRPS